MSYINEDIGEKIIKSDKISKKCVFYKRQNYDINILRSKKVKVKGV